MSVSESTTHADLASGVALLERVGPMVRQLYRDGRGIQPEAFSEWALGLLRRIVRFDSAMWSHGHSDPLKMHDVVVVDQPGEMLRNYPRVRKDDVIAQACNRHPGRAIDLYDVIGREAFLKRPLYRLHARRFGIENVLCIVLPETVSGLVGSLSLWRARYEDRYDASDRACLEFMMPHLVEARRQRTLDWMRQPTWHGAVQQAAVAICDTSGVLHEFDDHFVATLQHEWPQWSGPGLPEGVAESIRRVERGRIAAGACVIEWSPFDRRHFLRAHVASQVDRLTRREGEVARLLIEGHTHKLIAQRLGLSPNTARSHISSLYKRLGVSNRAQMIAAVTSVAGVRPTPIRRRT